MYKKASYTGKVVGSNLFEKGACLIFCPEGGHLFRGGRLFKEIRYLIRDITKISTCRVNTTSNRGKNLLAISFSATCMFVLFKNSRGSHT